MPQAIDPSLDCSAPLALAHPHPPPHPPPPAPQAAPSQAPRYESQSPTSAQSPNSGSGGDPNKTPPRARLTEQEKKNNHIASEQKRRNAIRDGFDRLTELIPGCEGQGRSEGMVLGKSIDYIERCLEDRRQLLERIRELGGTAPADLQIP